MKYMKKILLGLITIAVIGVSGLLVINKTTASSSPPPSSLDASGTGPCHLGPVQFPGGKWTLSFTYTQLNDSASITILNSDSTINNYKLIPNAQSGTIVLPESISSPVYIDCYANAWHITAAQD